MQSTTEETRVCCVCKQEKLLKQDFYLHRNGKPRWACKACYKAKSRIWAQNRTAEQKKKYETAHAQYRERMRQENPDKWAAMARAQNVKKRNGISQKEVDRLLAEQDGKCAICRCPWGLGARDGVDHCHATGKIRGLLCQNCNGGLGRFLDDIEILEAAIAYLRKHAS